MPALRWKRLPARYAGIVMPFVLSIMMSGIVSFVATVKNIGLPSDIVMIWLGAWRLSWVISFPVLLIVLPIVRKIVGLLVEPPLN